MQQTPAQHNNSTARDVRAAEERCQQGKKKGTPHSRRPPAPLALNAATVALVMVDSRAPEQSMSW